MKCAVSLLNYSVMCHDSYLILPIRTSSLAILHHVTSYCQVNGDVTRSYSTVRVECTNKAFIRGIRGGPLDGPWGSYVFPPNNCSAGMLPRMFVHQMVQTSIFSSHVKKYVHKGKNSCLPRKKNHLRPPPPCIKMARPGGPFTSDECDACDFEINNKRNQPD